jgi:hypothetical protein
MRRFLEFLRKSQGLHDIVTIGDGSSAQNTLTTAPHDLVTDACYIHGDPTYGRKRAISLNSASTSIINSYIAEIKAGGQNSQAIAEGTDKALSRLRTTSRSRQREYPRRRDRPDDSRADPGREHHSA